MQAFWNGKRVIVTGGAGMIGSVLTEMLVGFGADVIVLDDFSRGETRVNGAKYAHADAGSIDVCKIVFDKAFAVFNLAAYVAGVKYNQNNMLRMFAENIRLQVEPVRAAVACHVERFLQTSTVCVYAPEYQAPAVEPLGLLDDPHPANAGYSWAKRVGERAALWADGTHAVVVRPTNAYGPRDYFDERAHVIPALIKKFIEDDEPIINGHGNVWREFIHARDVATGMLHALTYGDDGGTYNLGTSAGTRVSIRELAGLVADATGNPDKGFRFADLYDGGDSVRWTDSSLAGREIGWQYDIGLEEGLAETVAWYRRAR